MKIYQKWFNAGWCAACILLCVCAHPAKDRLKMYDKNSKSFDSEIIGYGFEEEITTSKLSEIIEDSLEEFEEKGPTTMRAITTRAKSNVVLLPLIIEPEAEMLPPGYKSVKPPGVSHMELASGRSQIDSSGRGSATLRASTKGKSDRFDQDDDADYAASKHETQIARNDRGSDSRAVSEVSSKGNSKKEKKKSKYSESSGVRKSHFENEDLTKNHKKKAAKKKKGAIYKTKDNREKTHNAAGYRNVYRKDEFKKDADFYDNERQGGHFENHGRYGEKHAIAEGTYAKGKKRSQIDREGSQQSEEARRDEGQEAQGHTATDSSET